MRRIGIGLLVVCLLGVAAVQVARSRLEQSDALRESLHGVVRSQLGASLRPVRIELDLWPSRVHLREPVLELAGDGLLELGEAWIDLDSKSLFAGEARVLGLSVSGPARFQGRQLELQGDLQIELRPAEGAHTWSLDLEARLDSGGRVTARGGLLPGGGFEGKVALDDLESAPFAQLLTSDQGEHPRLSGAYGGTFQLADPQGPEFSILRLSSPQAEIQVASVRLEGPVALVAQLPGVSPARSSPVESGARGFRGRFAADASNARVEYAGGFTKASGQGASLEGWVVRGPDARLRLEEVGLKIQRFEGQALPGRAGADDAR